jgi:hypothetical protein
VEIVDGSKEKVLYQGSEGVGASDPSWSRVGDKIAVVLRQVGKNSELLVLGIECVRRRCQFLYHFSIELSACVLALYSARIPRNLAPTS